MSDLKKLNDFFINLENENLYTTFLMAMNAYAYQEGEDSVTVVLQIFISMARTDGLDRGLPTLKKLMQKMKMTIQSSVKNAQEARNN